MNDNLQALIKKYDVPVPRYTSYPAVPLWDTEKFDPAQWPVYINRSFNESGHNEGISLYIHLPFCESLCTYCACNTRITKDHRVEEKYVQAILNEWDLYLQILNKIPVIRELHLGGGTPTFFNPNNLTKLVGGILGKSVIHTAHEFSFEGHPNNTTREHLHALRDLGFTRVSYGVQDLNDKVQNAVHRVQPIENLEQVTRWSREAGYQSISFDLIYGLPYQTVDTVSDTVEKVIRLRPDRLSFYSYAHVPWIRPGQRGYEDADLPGDVIKRSLYETGRRLFREAGYYDVGMDHFALPDDTLCEAQLRGTLHRNFMGYTTNRTNLLIGLGVSAVSDAGYAYAQNEKKVEDYYAHIADGRLPVTKGHAQSAQDLLVKECILQIICAGKLSNRLIEQLLDYNMFNKLKVMEEEGLVRLSEEGLYVTPTGRIFVRNICSLFDVRMRDQQMVEGGSVFSRSI